MASKTLSGFKGRRRTRASVALKTAFATARAVGVTAGSPTPDFLIAFHNMDFDRWDFTHSNYFVIIKVS
jgi:hypothetical protein